MGMGFDLTLNHPDITPFYLKVQSDSVYTEKSGDAFTLDTANGTIDTTKYWAYNASMLLSTGKKIQIADTSGSTAKFATNYADKKKAGHRLVVAYINDVTTNLKYHPIYEWYQDINNYEILYLVNTGGNVNLYYYAIVGGNIIYDRTVVGIGLTVGWHVFQVHFSYTGANRQAGVYIDGQSVSAMANALVAADISIAGVAKFSIGYSENYTVSLDGYIDTALIRQGLCFSLSFTDQPTDPAWQGGGYVNRAYEGNTIPISLGTLVNQAPSVFAENNPPQGIPDFAIVNDILYLVGVGNYKVFAAPCNIVQPDPDCTDATFKNTTRWSYASGYLHKGTIIAGGALDVGNYLIGISLFNSTNGMESKISEFVGKSTNRYSNTTVINITAGNQEIRYNVFHKLIGAAAGYDKLKLWLKDTGNGKIYYCGMYTPTISGLDTGNVKVNTALSNFQEYTKFNIPDIYFAYPLGIDKPGTPTATDVAGTLTLGDYQAACVNIDPFTGAMSGASLSNKLTTALGGVNIALASNTVSTALYKTLAGIRYVSGGDQSYYLAFVGVAAGNPRSWFAVSEPAGPFGITIPDQLIAGTISDLTLNKPQPCNYIEAHNDRLWYACFTNAKNKVMWSERDQLELVSDNSFFIVGDNDECITGLLSFFGILLVFKERSMWMITGNSPDTYDIQPISKSIGCVSHRSIQLINNAAYWCAYDGPYIYDGSAIYSINDDIRDLFGNMDYRSRAAMFSAVDKENNLYMLGIRTATTQTTADSLDTVAYNYNADKILCYNYNDSDIGNKIFIWTVIDTALSDMDSGVLSVNARTNVVGINTIPNSGSNPGTYGSSIGFFNVSSFKDHGNWSTNNVSWLAEFNPYTGKIGRNNTFVDLTYAVGCDKLTQNINTTVGVKHRGVSYTSTLVMANGVEQLQKSLKIKSRYLSAIISGSSSEEFNLLGFDFKTRVIDYR